MRVARAMATVMMMVAGNEEGMATAARAISTKICPKKSPNFFESADFPQPHGEITVFPNLRDYYENDHYVQIVFCVTSFPALQRNYCSFPTYLIFTRIITCMNSFRKIPESQFTSIHNFKNISRFDRGN